MPSGLNFAMNLKASLHSKASRAASAVAQPTQAAEGDPVEEVEHEAPFEEDPVQDAADDAPKEQAESDEEGDEGEGKEGDEEEEEDEDDIPLSRQKKGGGGGGRSRPTGPGSNKDKARKPKPKPLVPDYDLVAVPRDGIAVVPKKGVTPRVSLIEVLYEPPNAQILPWSAVAARDFIPREEDVYRLWLRYNWGDKHSEQFMLACKTAKTKSGSSFHAFRWLSLKAETELLAKRRFNNGDNFADFKLATQRILHYNNRLPGDKNLAREGFVSDHIAQLLGGGRHFTKPSDFKQLDELAFDEATLYMPTDILNRDLFGDKSGDAAAEQAALDGLVVEDEEEEEEDEAENGAAATASAEAGWVERPSKSVAAKKSAGPSAPKPARSRAKTVPATGTPPTPSASRLSFLFPPHNTHTKK